MKIMFVNIITDCHDSATLGRQRVRAANLFKSPVIPIGVNGELNDRGQIEAAGNLIDILEVSEKQPGVILVNAAPRSHKKWPNGSPFGYFWWGQTLVVSTVDGYTLSLIKKFKLVDRIQLLDIPTVIDYMVSQENFDSDLGEYIKNTQFRSLEFLPRAAKWVFEGVSIPTDKYDIDNVPDPHKQVWLVDNFGNLKTTVTATDIDFQVGQTIDFHNIQGLMCYDRLKDVPTGDVALIEGSSGLRGNKFLEIVVQGFSAADKLGMKQGDDL
jgi:hypothetical protein